jgi:transposase
MSEQLLDIERKAEEHRHHIENVARLYRQGWRSTKLVLHFRRSPAVIDGWLREAQQIGLIPPRRRGRPPTKRRYVRIPEREE